MAMFGNMAKKKGPFDFSPEIYTTPGIGDGLPNVNPMGDPGLGMTQPTQPSKFGIRDIVGIIGEALGGAAGNGPGAYTQSKLREREIAERQRQAMVTRGVDWQDWVAKQQYEAANRLPPQPLEIERLLSAAGYQPGTPEYASMIRQAAQNKVNPIQGVPITNPDGSTGIQFIRPNMVGGAKGGGQSSVGNPAPQGAIDYLRSNPSAADQFDAKYGKGAAASILGGGGSNATGSFPR